MDKLLRLCEEYVGYSLEKQVAESQLKAYNHSLRVRERVHLYDITDNTLKKETLEYSQSFFKTEMHDLASEINDLNAHIKRTKLLIRAHANE